MLKLLARNIDLELGNTETSYRLWKARGVELLKLGNTHAAVRTVLAEEIAAYLCASWEEMIEEDEEDTPGTRVLRHAMDFYLWDSGEPDPELGEIAAERFLGYAVEELELES